MRSKTTSNQAIRHGGGWLNRMGSFFTVLAVMLLLPLTAIAGTWNGADLTFNFQLNDYSSSPKTWALNDGYVKKLGNKDLYLFDADGVTNGLEGFFAASGNFGVGSGTWWLRRRSSSTTDWGLFNTNSADQYFSVLKLRAGDLVTITYSGTPITFVDKSQVNNPPSNDNNVVSGTPYTIKNNGELDLYVVRNSNNGATYIQSVTITFNSTRLEIDTRDVWGNGVFPAGTIDGMPYYRYRLSSRWFAEPLIQARGWTALDESVGTKGFTVEPYSSDNCKNPTNK